MAISNWNQFVLLLWKNWVLQKRRKVLTVFQVLIPAAFAFILFLIRMRVQSDFVAQPTIWNSFEVEPRLPPNIINLTYKLNFTSNPFMLAFTPNASIVQEIIAQLTFPDELDLNPYSFLRGIGFNSEAEIETYFAGENPATKMALGALVFDTNSLDDTGNNFRTNATIKYKIRLRAEQFNASYVSTATDAGDWLTNVMFPLRQTNGPRGDMYGGDQPGYYYEGFLGIQRAVDLAIMQLLKMKSTNPFSVVVPDVSVRLKSFPYPPYSSDKFLSVIQTQLPFIIMLSFIVTAPTICKDVVLEKEKKLKESMKLMGMKAWLHWASWYFKFFVFMLVSVLFMTFFYHIKVGGKAVLTYTNPSVTFVFLLLYSLSVMTFCFAISTFFSKASAGAAAGGIIYLVSYFPFFFLGNSYRYAALKASSKYGISLVCNLAMAIGCVTISQFESSGAGVQWSTISTPVNVDDQFTMRDTMVMLVIDIIFYSIITWYFDALKPGDFGTPQPFYFPFTKWYWCGRSSNSIDADRTNVDDVPDFGDKSDFFEPTSSANKVGIKIRNLTKKFSKKQRPAVNKLNIDMLEGDITALLGHNGAGKTTTMFMLTGFIPPTSGTAYINGLDLRRDMVKIRENLGLCPQHDVLFDTMTVVEHLTFFAKLKGSPYCEVPQEVDRMLNVLHLEDKRDTPSKSLSGGMKRKLSVGIALIAGSKFVILDEPTSGMDPEARRQAWDILQSQRAGRTMILSTHFMDEADLLGDRIAIMADGQLQCCGSSLFLKNKYGIGYHLTIVKDQRCNVEKLAATVRNFIPEAQLESNVGAELSFILPKEKSAQFEGLFTELEQNQTELGINSFGASVTTLEEVFLKVGEICDSTLQNDLQNGQNGLNGGSSSARSLDSNYLLNGGENNGEKTRNGAGYLDINGCETLTQVSSSKSLTGLSYNTAASDDMFGVSFEKQNGLKWYTQQFYAMLIKHMIHSWRNKVVTIVQLAVPVVFAIIGCIVTKTIAGPTDPPALPLNLSYFTDTTVPFSIGATDPVSQTLGNTFSRIADQFGIPENKTSQDIDTYLLSIATTSMDRFNRLYHVAGTVNSSGNSFSNQTTITGHFNNRGLHTIAISLAMIDNAVTQLVFPGYNIETINHPLPRSVNTKASDSASTAMEVGFIFSYCVSFGMAFMIGTFVIFVINERSTKAKHAQFVSGVGITNFWLSAFIWDAVSFLIPSILIVIVIAAFQLAAYSADTNAGLVFLDLVLYGWSILPFVYLQSFLFQVASTGYTWVTVFNIFSGTAAVLTVFILSLPGLGTEAVSSGLEWVFYVILPNFCFNKALQDIYLNYQYRNVCTTIDNFVKDRTAFCNSMAANNRTNPCCPGNCGDMCLVYHDNFLAWESPGIGRSVFFMIIQGALFLAIVFALDSGSLQRLMQTISSLWTSTNVRRGGAVHIIDQSGTDEEGGAVEMELVAQPAEDDDVKAERERIKQTPLETLTKNEPVVLRELTKFYNGNFLAVDRLSLGVPRGECFGLLGVNGAGKTTTFMMLTGDHPVSAGDAYLGGNSVLSDIKSAQQLIGYCPQFDALIDQMTVEETLWMYARLRGITEKDIGCVVEKLIDQLTLRKHAKKEAKNLSGGNRRKLSTGIALIGNPSVIFLDEPTTGMDPVARRLLWNTLSRVRDSGRTLILTSHSMEECEALCTRLAVMVNGRFQCLGSTQHLKTKFSDGYSLIIKVRTSNQTTNASQFIATVDSKTRKVMSFVDAKFPGSQLKDQHDGLLHYRVTNTNGECTWAYVFGAIERAKEELEIEDYSVSQTTLEQIFISFARMQREPQEIESVSCLRRCCCCCCRDNEDSDDVH